MKNSAFVLFAAFCQGAEVKLPPPFATPSSTNRPRVIPQRKKLIEKLDRPYGLAFWKDYLYVAETTSVKRYMYDAKQMTVGAGQEVVNMKDYGKGHWTRAVLFDR